MNDKTAKLIQLIKDNPTLPVIPIVNYEVVGSDDKTYWHGSFGDCFIGGYAMYQEMGCVGTEDLKEEYFHQHYEEYQGMPSDLIEADLEKKTKDMWTEVIIVYIESNYLI